MMPALFIGHGSPMNAIMENPHTAHLRELGRTLPRPAAIVVVSAHWQTQGTKVLRSEQPRQIYDFYGFPEELYKLRYNPRGSTSAASLVREALQAHHAEFDESWGLDHGAWCVLQHMYPQADVPVLQLSLDRNLDLDGHLRLAASLRPLRDAGLMILGSGNISHNLREVDFAPDAPAAPWAVAFDELIKRALIEKNVSQLVAHDPAQHALWRRALPTLEHYIPLLYVVGASDRSEPPVFPFAEIQNGSLSMRTVLYSGKQESVAQNG